MKTNQITPKRLAVYGAVVAHGKLYEDDEILQLSPNRGWVYGIHWVFAGDQFFEESNIFCPQLNQGQSFGGRHALKNFLLSAKAHTA